MDMIGKIIIKTAGREAGYKAVIIEELDSNYVFISSGGINKVRRRRVNIKHLIVTEQQVDLESNASEDEVKAAIEDADLVDDFKEQADPSDF